MKAQKQIIFGKRNGPVPTHLVEAALVSKRIEAMVSGDTKTVAQINLRLQNLVR